MLNVLANRTYRRLFSAQVVALIGTGMTTVALGLLAYDLAGNKGSAVLGTALAIKMVAYVGVAPVVGGFANLLPRRAFLISMDLVRAIVALALPFVSEVWQVYVLIFLLQSASAAFTPTFQATIPDVLPDETEYTRALSLSRIAYDLESLLSPMLAAALLTVITFNWLFLGTVVGFLCSAALVLSVTVPQPPRPERHRGIYENTTRGIRIYLATPRLRGLLALNLSVAAAGAMAIVNTAVIVKGMLNGSDSDVAIALACFGGGSMIAAFTLPKLLDRFADRNLMLTSAGILVVALLGFAIVNGMSSSPLIIWSALLSAWLFLGIAYSAAMTPSGRLLRRSAHAGDRPAVFAAQFALSHGCWLLTYPLAGWLGSKFGIAPTAFALAMIAILGALLALLVWPKTDADVVLHSHPDLSPDHPHLRDQYGRHAHAFVIDDLHHRWP
jgi:H+ antiporter protein